MKHYLYALGAILCWASLPAATGSSLTGMSVPLLMVISFCCAAIYLYAQDVVCTRSFRIYFPDCKVSLLGIWGIFGYHYVYYNALNKTPLAEAAILTTTWSFWIVVFSALLLFRRIKLSIVLTALAGLTGAAMVIAAGKDLVISMQYMQGYMLSLLCGLIWASFSVGLSKSNMKANPMTAFTVYAALLSVLMYLVSPAQPVPSAQNILAAMYLGCVPLGLSFFLWSQAVRGGNMVVIGFLSYLTPPLAVLMVAIVNGEAVSEQVIFGMVVIIAASIAGRFALEQKEECS